MKKQQSLSNYRSIVVIALLSLCSLSDCKMIVSACASVLATILLLNAVQDVVATL